jgi:hypothetical protein
MTTTNVTTCPILAIDLGKYKSVACIYHAADQHRFHSFPTSRDELARLLDQHRPCVVLIEACLLAGWVDVGPQGTPISLGNYSKSRRFDFSLCGSSSGSRKRPRGIRLGDGSLARRCKIHFRDGPPVTAAVTSEKMASRRTPLSVAVESIFS